MFVSGLELSARLYREAVRPLLAEHLPALAHTAALVGPGSEVLGFDTARSTDHDWGPRLQLFLPADDHADAVSALLAERLPDNIAGYPTHQVPFEDEPGTWHMGAADGPVRHGVVVAGLRPWLTAHLGFDPTVELTALDWLATPTQVLAETTAGAVLHDDLGFRAIRRRLAWYPDDVWRYVLACQWRRVSQEEAFVGRCGEVGDELGSAVVAARLTRDLMRLCLLMNRRYPPYGKWLGSAFAALPCADRLTPVLTSALAATDWHDREHHLALAHEIVATLHNDTGLTEPVDPRTRPFHARPFRVLHADRFAVALTATIGDPAIRDLPLTGAVDQFVDSTDALADRARTRRLASAGYHLIR